MKRKYTALFCLGALALAGTVRAANLFREVDVQSETWAITFFENGSRYDIQIDDTPRGKSGYLQSLTLKSAERLRLTGRHSRLEIKPGTRDGVAGIEITLLSRNPTTGQESREVVFECTHTAEAPAVAESRALTLTPSPTTPLLAPTEAKEVALKKTVEAFSVRMAVERRDRIRIPLDDDPRQRRYVLVPIASGSFPRGSAFLEPSWAATSTTRLFDSLRLSGLTLHHGPSSLSSAEPESMEPWSKALADPSDIPEDLRGSTSDPAIVELLHSFMEEEIGLVKETESGTQQFRDQDRLVFEAPRIGARSRTDSGTFAVEAVTGNETPINEAELMERIDTSRLVGSPREIWLVAPSGQRTKVSPPNVDAFLPIISPDGKIVAFTGRLLDQQGLPGLQRIYILDLANGLYRTYGTSRHPDQYKVSAVDWIENASVLRVVQDYGETGGHLQLMKIKVR